MQTFLVRVWQPDPNAPEPDIRLRGVLQPLGSAVSLPFRGPEELIGCIVLALDGARDVDGVAGDFSRDGHAATAEGANE